ncbi:unnamed protein product [Durusdinium trenchii]|uniref:Uncharacterized protein n=1 Tax=Durusdinium trenchii TaxID=1381693 RepID=A0ABP0IX68_9DINO
MDGPGTRHGHFWVPNRRFALRNTWASAPRSHTTRFSAPERAGLDRKHRVFTMLEHGGPSLMRGGEYADQAPVEAFVSAGGLFAKSESMEITNDPRFFQDNVLGYRLAAFAGMGVVAGLMVQNSLDSLFDMSKALTFKGSVKNHIDSWFQLAAILLLAVVHFLNIIATYVGVAQPYHTIRLMTAGPTGFESAACYYLNKNIVAWRHFAVFGALLSMPMFLLSCGLRMMVKFDRENYDWEETSVASWGR